MKLYLCAIFTLISIECWAIEFSHDTVIERVIDRTQSEVRMSTDDGKPSNFGKISHKTEKLSQPLRKLNQISQSTPPLILDTRVVQAMFTSNIIDKKPQNNLFEVDHKTNNIFFFTELRNMKGKEAIHRWYFNNKLVSENRFNIETHNWPIWSSTDFTPTGSGTWKVSVLDDTGELLAEQVLYANANKTSVVATETYPDDENY